MSMEILSPTIINACATIIKEDLEISKDNNPKNIYEYSFVSHDKCVGFLDYLNINNVEAFLSECKHFDITVEHNLIVKIAKKYKSLKEWGGIFKLGIDDYRTRIQEKEYPNKFQIKWMDQIVEEHILLDLDTNRKSRNAFFLIREQIEMPDNQSELNRVGNEGEELTLIYENSKTEVLKAKKVSPYSDSKGYDVESIYKDSSKKLIEVKTSRSSIKTGSAHISYGQWKKACEIQEVKDRDFIFHFWSLDENKIAEITSLDIKNKIRNISGDDQVKSHWEKFEVFFSDFKDKFHKPFN